MPAEQSAGKSCLSGSLCNFYVPVVNLSAEISPQRHREVQSFIVETCFSNLRTRSGYRIRLKDSQVSSETDRRNHSAALRGLCNQA